MRKILIILSLASLAMGAAPGQAAYRSVKSGNITFKGATPCFGACSYNYVAPHDPARTALYLGAVVNDFKNDTHTSEYHYQRQMSYSCSHPGPQGSWKDVIITAPRYATRLVVIGKPTVDWDIFLCAKPRTGNNGSMLAHEQWQYIDQCPAACTARLESRVRAGYRYVLRAYAWADPLDFKVRYTFYR